METELQAEIFNSRCHDTGEPVTIDRAKIFKEEWEKFKSTLPTTSPETTSNLSSTPEIILTQTSSSHHDDDIRINTDDSLNIEDHPYATTASTLEDGSGAE